MPAAARVGTGWPLALIRDTLYRATRAGRDPWAALADLGQRIGVTELRDLGPADRPGLPCTRALNALLANYAIHYQKLRNYHWNVKGSDFFDLHEQFESQYTEAIKNIDDIAERIRIFGETPMSTLKDYIETSEIKETGTNLTSELMVRELLSDYRILLPIVSTMPSRSRRASSG